MLEGKDGYKYLGIIEDNRSWESYTKLQSALYTRVKHLCNTRLNGKIDLPRNSFTTCLP
ncbi:hypothetical protein PAEPH01_0255 [Pancytospora epiphaga]|nr:hypothetical protein PAEPH01_0255 [Pancytospora epiphaga]